MKANFYVTEATVAEGVITKRRTDSNSPTEPNEASRVSTFYYYNIYLIKTKRTAD